MSGNNFALGAATNKMDLHEKENVLSSIVHVLCIVHLIFSHTYLADREKSLMAHSLATKLGKRRPGNYDAVGNTTLLSAPLCACVCACMRVCTLLRVLSVETDVDVSRVASRRRRWMGGGDGRRGGRMAIVNMKGRKINRTVKAGREGTMNSWHMRYIKRG